MVENGLNLRRVILTDPATNEPQPVPRKIGQFGAAGRYSSVYSAVLHPVQQACTESTTQWLRRSWDSHEANLALVSAAAKGESSSDLAKDASTLADNNVEVLVRAAELSEFHTVGSAQAVVKMLGSYGVTAQFEVMKNAPHAAIMTTRSWTDPLKQW